MAKKEANGHVHAVCLNRVHSTGRQMDAGAPERRIYTDGSMDPKKKNARATRESEETRQRTRLPTEEQISTKGIASSKEEARNPHARTTSTRIMAETLPTTRVGVGR